MDNGSRRVLLIAPPLSDPGSANVGMATLQVVLRRAGIATDTLYGDLLLPRIPTEGAPSPRYAMFYSVPLLHPEVTPAQCAEAALRQARFEAALDGIWADPGAELDGERAARAARAQIEATRVGLLRCIEAARGYAVVGFSCTFEVQLVAALALATQLKARDPAVRIALGGAACFGETAEEIVRSYPVVDAVCNWEGERVIVPLVEALQGRRSLEQVPGIAWLDQGRVRSNPPPPLIEEMDELPIPDYDDLLSQLAASEWRDLAPRLYFETSRGCWWGQKHLCTFCGLNAEGLVYRAKSPERAYREIVELYERYPTAERLMATDNILDMRYLRTVLPRLAELAQRKRPLRLFFEIKSNLTREQVGVLARAGVDVVQSGIESFSDGLLTLMRKGSTALMQVQCIKWLYEEGIRNNYNVLIRNPGESAEQYREMSALVPFLEHLPPPHLGTIWLERFSPYFNEPHRYGISGVRPKQYYATLFRAPGVDLGRMAYCFDFDHPELDAQELTEARREFIRRIIAWVALWRPEMAYYLDGGDHLEIIDDRTVRGRLPYRLPGAARLLYRFLDRARSTAAIARRFPDLDPQVLQCALETWIHRRWVCCSGDQYLAVLPSRKRPTDGARLVAA